MRILFSLYLLIIINIALSIQCQHLTTQGHYLLELKHEGQESIMNVSPILFYSNGVEIKDKTIKFIDGSTLFLGNYKYHAVECDGDKLTIEVVNLFKNVSTQHYIIAKVNKIIDDPVNQIDTLNSMCNQLSFRGTYNIELDDQNENTLKVKIRVNTIATILFHYKTLLTDVEYQDAFLEIGEGNKEKIYSCRDYKFESKLRIRSKSFIIKKIDPLQSDKVIRDGYCKLLSVKGSYILWDGNKNIGKLDVKEDSAYKSKDDFINKRFFLDYNAQNYPILTDDKLVENKIELCSVNQNGYIIKINRLHNNLYNFTKVTVLHQDSSFLFASKEKILAELEQKYHLSKPIDYTEIEGFMHSSLHIDFYEGDFCRRLIMPGTYIIIDKNDRKYKFINKYLISIRSFNGRSDNVFKTIFRFWAKVVSKNEEDYQVYTCEVFKHKSKIINNEDESTPKTSSSTEDLLIASIESFIDTSDKRWIDNNHYKILLRSKSECSQIEAYKNYKLHTFNDSIADVVVKSISYREFYFVKGFLVYFINKNVKSNNEYSNIIITGRDKKETTNKLWYCFSNENGSYFYDTNYQEQIEKHQFVPHEKKYLSEYKFLKLEKL